MLQSVVPLAYADLDWGNRGITVSWPRRFLAGVSNWIMAGPSNSSPGCRLEPLSLEYSRVRTKWWAGAIFRPSFRSLVLLLLIAPTIVWVGRRHVPWRADAFVPSELDGRRPSPTYDSHVWFLPNNELLAFSQATGVSRVDLATGKIVKTISSCERGTGYLELDHGLMAVVPSHSATLEIHDVQSGSKVRELPNPLGANYSFVAMSGDGSRMVTGAFQRRILRSSTQPGTVAQSSPQRTTRPPRTALSARPIPRPRTLPVRVIAPRTERNIVVWNLTEHPSMESIKPHETLSAYNVVSFADKQGLLVIENSSGQAVVDLSTMRQVLKLANPMTGTPHQFGTDRVIVNTVAGVATTTHLYDATGKEIDRFVGTAPFGYWSRDLSLRVERTGANRSAVVSRTDLVDRRTGRVVRSMSDRMSPPRFFSDSKKFVVTTQIGSRFQTGIYDLRHVQPLAVLDDEPAAGFMPDVIDVAPDDNTILKRLRLPTRNGYLLFHRTGWDCPESALGMLAFPHVWLLAVLIMLASVSLMNDARASAALESAHLPGLIMAGLWLASAVLTIDFVLEACRGNWLRSPAPLLLVLTIGLAGRSRFWRVAGFIILSAAIGWCCLIVSKIPASNVVGILDRNYDIPQRFRTAIMVASIVGLLICIVLLALPRRLEMAQPKLA